jgi:hypothetical protein
LKTRSGLQNPLPANQVRQSNDQRPECFFDDPNGASKIRRQTNSGTGRSLKQEQLFQVPAMPPTKSQSQHVLRRQNLISKHQRFEKETLIPLRIFGAHALAAMFEITHPNANVSRQVAGLLPPDQTSINQAHYKIVTGACAIADADFLDSMFQ